MRRIPSPHNAGGSVLILLLFALAATLMSGCSSPRSASPSQPAPRAPETVVQSLCQDIRRLSSSINPHEAQAVADIAVNHALDLADQYRVVKPASLHNVLVNLGIKERGLCYHWADDMLDRLSRVPQTTLEFHRVVSNPNARHEHNALVVSARHRPFEEGFLLDAWRRGGRLFWIRVPLDKHYRWELRKDLTPSVVPAQTP